NNVDEKLRMKARTLFAEILENIGSIKIKTIHAFCEEILKKFPYEAGVNPHFVMLGEDEKKGFLKKVLESVFETQDVEIKDASAYLFSFINEDTWNELQKKIINSSDKLSSVFRQDIKQVEEKIKVALDIKCEDTDILRREFLKYNLMDIKLLLTQQNDFTEKKREEIFPALKLFCDLNDNDKIKNFDTLFSIFLKKDGGPYKSPKHELFLTLSARIYEAKTKEDNLVIFNQTKAVIKLAKKFLEKYKQQKEALGLMDFDDLISATFALFSRDDVASWILYKMNGGISHILLDEAQDTSPLQWKILTALSEDFFETSDGQIDDINKFKSLFVVGDRKQSIYSFQGADIDNYQKYLEIFQSKVKQYNHPWLVQDMVVSFRSSETVLKFVDFVFSEKTVSDGVSNEKISHENAKELSGKIELYPTVKIEQNEKKQIYEKHFEGWIKNNAKAKLAKAVVAKIKNILESKIVLSRHETGEEKDRFVEPRDIIILVKKRLPYADYLNKELKQAGIEFDGIDKFKLLNDMAVEDLINIGKFAVFPYDELTLAGVFKSPIIGGSEAELFELAYNRNDENLWDRILNSSNKSIMEKREKLLSVLENKDKTPYEFYSFILDRLEGKKLLLKRLGLQALDGINYFMNTAMQWDSKRVSNISGFLETVINSDIEIAREGQGNFAQGVKIMTVHGAKGLEGRFVFLVDTDEIGSKKSAQDNKLLFYKDFVIFYSDKALKNSLIEEIIESVKKAQYQEYKRLLYVALTRAKQNLYIFTSDKFDEGSWYDILSKSFDKYQNVKKENIPDYLGEFYDENDKILSVENEKIFEKNEIEIAEKKVEAQSKDFVYPKLEKIETFGIGKEKKASSIFTKDDIFEVGNRLHSAMQNVVLVEKANRFGFIKSVIESLDVEQKVKDNYLESMLKIFDEFPWIFENSSVEQEVIIKNGKSYKSHRIDNLGML
ncbi:MAG: UvrD-helicase domain-containing protein, partial [Rickettsiales bacterium]|nr:UvrD-helicase domain-containing protein [Rickettsiales bacterium]